MNSLLNYSLKLQIIKKKKNPKLKNWPTKQVNYVYIFISSRKSTNTDGAKDTPVNNRFRQLQTVKTEWKVKKVFQQKMS